MNLIPAVPREQPLPPNPFNLESQARIHTAYERCLASEREAQSDQERMTARCLGYFLTELPIAGKCVVAEDVIRCNCDQQKLERLAILYINHVIRLFRGRKGETPAPSDDSSLPRSLQPSFFDSVAVEPEPRSHKAAKRAALERDNYRCMITGCLDAAKYMDLSQSPAALQAMGWENLFTVHTNFCHIFPPSINWELNPNEPDSPKVTSAGRLWELVCGFSGINALDELAGEKVHSLTNGLTLATGLRICFDSLDLWFEEVPGATPNTYWVRAMLPEFGLPDLEKPITFTTTSETLVLPDPRYLRLHAAVCRVAQMSGVAQYLYECDRDMEFVDVLDKDGASGELLASRLHDLALTR